MGNEHGKTGGAAATPAGIQSMDEALQKRFAKGIQFNSEREGTEGERCRLAVTEPYKCWYTYCNR